MEMKKVYKPLFPVAIGEVPKYFWAACQICDRKPPEGLADLACLSAPVACVLAGQTQKERAVVCCRVVAVVAEELLSLPAVTAPQLLSPLNTRQHASEPRLTLPNPAQHCPLFVIATVPPAITTNKIILCVVCYFRGERGVYIPIVWGGRMGRWGWVWDGIGIKRGVRHRMGVG